MKYDEDVVLRDLTDEELDKIYGQGNSYKITKRHLKGKIDERATVRGLLKEYGIKYDDLPDWLQEQEVGRCNSANRTEYQIYINRPNSKYKDKMIINLNPNREVPYLTVQTQINDNFIYERAYSEKGAVIYKM